MKHEPAWRRYLRIWGPEPASDVDDEFQFHIQTKTDALIGAGMPPVEARREALRQFGPLREIRRECCAVSKERQAKASRAEYLMGWWRDAQYAVRILAKTKASSAAAISILALGLGASTAVFTVLDRLLYRPLPVPKPSELLLISESHVDESGKRVNGNLSYEEYLYLRDQNRSLAGLAAEATLGPGERHGRQKIERPASARAVSGNFFQVLGVGSLLGRTLTPADDNRSATSVAVASYRFWTRRYGRSPDVVGQSVYLKDRPFTIVGVLREEFSGIHKANEPDLYIPIGRLQEVFGFNPLSSGGWFSLLVGRLRPGVSQQTGRNGLQALAGRFASEPAPGETARRGALIECESGASGTPGTSGEKRRSLMLVTGIVGLLLLMACANVACLLIARGVARRHEIAIRLSLGAGKARVLRQLLMESLLLSVAGGAAGFVLAQWAGQLLLAAFRWQERNIDLSPDWRVMAFGLAASLVTGVLSGVIPAFQFLRGTRIAPNQERSVAPRFASGEPLVVLQVALSLVLVAGAAVFARSFQNLRSVPLGFSPEHVSVVELGSAGDQELGTLPDREAVDLADSLRGDSGIESVCLANFATFGDSQILFPLRLPGDASQAKTLTVALRVDPNYFSALRIPVVAGRDFSRQDATRQPRTVVLGEATARRLFASQNPIGRMVNLLPGQDAEVVGVVRDIKFSNVTAPSPYVLFQPWLQKEIGGARMATIKLQIRSRMSPENVAARVRARIVAGHLPLTVQSASALEDKIGASMQNDRIRMQASSLFGVLALALITAGIYGLTAYSVIRRTREIGIRMAVGSTPGKVARLVLRASLRPALIGVLIGLPGAVVVMKAISSMAFGLAPVDPVSLVVAAAVLIGAGIGGSVAPAWRAAHLDPVQALRVQ